MDKPQLRARMKRIRAAIPDRARQSDAICRHILALPEFDRAACVLLYMPIGSEADVRPVLERAIALGKTVCLPVCREGGAMDAVRYTGESCLRPGAFGIMEPAGDVVPPEEIELVLCPGLAFDPKGGRLGYGKGYYDRYLSKVHPFRAGVCYTECVIESVPVGRCDVPMSALVSPQGVTRMGRST